MKVLCKIRAFYDGEIVKPGQIVEIKGKDVPCWAKPVSDKATEEKTEQPTNLPEQRDDDVPCWAKPVSDKATEEKTEQPTNLPEQRDDDVPEVNTGNKTPENNPVKEQVNPQVAQELATKNESELNAILEDLRTQALEKNITVDADNKTVIEQINELKIKLDEVNK